MIQRLQEYTGYGLFASITVHIDAHFNTVIAGCTQLFGVSVVLACTLRLTLARDTRLQNPKASVAQALYHQHPTLRSPPAPLLAYQRYAPAAGTK